jgi:hypothetical protein
MSESRKKAKKCSFYFTKDTFSMYDIWMKDFFMIHYIVFELIGDNLENFYKVLETKFFDWLNQPKNYSKFMFEIKKEFMAMADEALLYEIMVERFKNSENRFLIPVLREDSESMSESDSDADIDLYSDPEPEPYSNIFDEPKNLNENLSDVEVSEYYLSFFT